MTITPEGLKKFMADNGSDVEEVAQVLADVVKDEIVGYLNQDNPHPVVLSALISCEDDLRHASMVYYVSTK